MKSPLNKTLLLVEDDSFIALAEVSMLKKAGYSVITAKNGKEAVKKFRKEQHIDLVLMDVDLGPGIDGGVAAQEILEIREVPVIFLSSHTEPDTVSKTDDITRYGYVVKDSGETVILNSINMAFQLFDAHRDVELHKESAVKANVQLAALNKKLQSGNDEFENLTKELLLSQGQLIRKEQELLRSRQLLRSILDTIPERVFWKDRDSRFLGCNDIFALDAGMMNPDDVIGKSDKDMSWAEHADLYIRDDQDVIKSGIPKVNIEEPQIDCRGEMRWLRTSKTPLKDKENNIVGLLGSYEDITEYKNAIEQLTETKETFYQQNVLLETLLDAIPDVIGVQDASHTIIRYNEAGYKFLNLKPEDAEGKKCYELIGRDLPCDICAASEVYETKKPAQLVKYFADLDLWLDVRSYPILDNDGNVVRIIEHLRDITDWKKSQQALLESEIKFRTLVEATSDWIWEVDCNGKYTYSSPKVKEILGYNPGEIIGLTPFDLMNKEEAVRIGEMFSEAAMKKGKIINLENVMLHKDGYCVVVETNGIPLLNGNGELIGYRGIDRDITERKETELQLKNSLAERESLFNELQHRVKNSLSMISSLVELEMVRTDEKSIKDILNKITMRIHSFINLYSLLNATGESKNIRLDSYIKSIADTLFGTYEHGLQGVNLKTNLDEISIHVKLAAPTGLIVNELVTNAMKYAFSKTKKGTVAIGLATKGDNVILKVEDNGLGINETKEYEKPESMGLELVSILVEQLGGTLKRTSKNGTKYIIDFPM